MQVGPQIASGTRVFHPAPPFATLLGFHLFFRSAVWKLLATFMVLATSFPPIAQFRLTVHVFNFPIFMAQVPLPLLILGQSSSLRLSTMDEATMEEEMIAEAPGATTFTLFIPGFLREYSPSEQSLEEQKNELLRKDWLTSGLTYEI